MKTRFFLAAMAAIALVGCNKNELGNENQVNDGPASFLKVDLRAAGSITRAQAEDAFEYGLAEENAVNTVHFYFFDADGTAYPVQGVQNFIAVSPEWEAGTPDVNVEEISDVVLVIKQSKKTPPAKMVAVLNAPAELQKTMSLAEFEDAVVTSLTTEDHFVMSNSVYVDNDVVVNAAEISGEHIFTADVTDYEIGDAIPADKVQEFDITPIEVYVERVAAKVRVSAAADVDLNLLPVKDADGNQMKFGETDLYAKVLGWQVTNAALESNLLKVVDPAWTDLGFTPWNNAALHRSYWAETSADPKHGSSFADLMNHNVAYDYYFENTYADAGENSVDVDAEGNLDNEAGQTGNQAAQLLVAAQIVDAEGNPVEMAKWYNIPYTIDDAKTAMVGTVAAKIYVKDGDVYSRIAVEDVEFYQVPQTIAEKRYEVKVRALEGVTYYKADGTAYAEEEVNAILDSVDPAQMWATGYAYYYLTIKHFGSANGIVRNHIYDVTIDGVAGLGTPVYDPDQIITPEKPEGQSALNLAARVNILAWHLVSQNVTLQ